MACQMHAVQKDTQYLQTSLSREAHASTMVNLMVVLSLQEKHMKLFWVKTVPHAQHLQHMPISGIADLPLTN